MILNLDSNFIPDVPAVPSEVEDYRHLVQFTQWFIAPFIVSDVISPTANIVEWEITNLETTVTDFYFLLYQKNGLGHANLLAVLSRLSGTEVVIPKQNGTDLIVIPSSFLKRANLVLNFAVSSGSSNLVLNSGTKFVIAA